MKPPDVSTKQQQIAELAKLNSAKAIKSLNHHIDLEWMKAAYDRTRKDGAVGIDGQTAEAYAKDLENNLTDLMNRLKSGTYKASPVRRHYIPKSDGSQRALGIPNFEDKVAQRTIAMLLEPIYEQDFKEFSFGYRPGKSPHQALKALNNGIMVKEGEWVLDVDLKKFFSSIAPSHLRKFVSQRVEDGVVRKLIDKWMKAGVFEEGQIHYPESGTPEGGVISPILSNIYLHYVLDEWYTQEVKPRLKGESSLVRFCDDFVMIFKYREDAERVMVVLGKRLERFGLKIHPEKTRLVRFNRPRTRTGERPETFSFLGFTHYWGKSQRGNRVLKVKTARDRFKRAMQKLNEQCRTMMHKPITEQSDRIRRMLNGHYQYYGVSDNIRHLQTFRHKAEQIWKKWLSRRSNLRSIKWRRFHEGLGGFLPMPRIKHKLYEL